MLSNCGEARRRVNDRSTQTASKRQGSIKVKWPPKTVKTPTLKIEAGSWGTIEGKNIFRIFFFLNYFLTIFFWGHHPLTCGHERRVALRWSWREPCSWYCVMSHSSEWADDTSSRCSAAMNRRISGCSDTWRQRRVRTRREHTDHVITEFLFSDFAPNDFLPRVRLSMFSFCDFCAKRLFPCPVAGSCYASGSACFRCAVTCGALLSMSLLRNFFQTVLAVFLRRTVPATCHARHVRTV